MRRARRLKDGSYVESYLPEKMTYAQASAKRRVAVCKCAGQRPGGHVVNHSRPYLEILRDRRDPAGAAEPPALVPLMSARCHPGI